MKGLELSRKYWEEVGRPAFEKGCPQVLEKATVGLVGEGSECYGFDDEISRDHDWGPGFCVWLTDADMKEFGGLASGIYNVLPESYMGFRRLNVSAQTGGRVGVMSGGSFYARYTGFDRVPQSIFEWRCAAEKGFAVATNGELFLNNNKECSDIREGLLAFYPEDLRLKKLAMRCAMAAQSGQYNYARCAHRGEFVAAFLACAEFVDHVQAIVFLLNKRYRPYYKWAHRAMKQLPVLGGKIAPQIELLSDAKDCAPASFHEKVDIIESISADVIAELKKEGLSTSPSDFLLQHAEEVQSRIADPQLRAMHLMAE